MADRDFGSFRRGERPEARALQNHADRLRELSPLLGPGVTTIAGGGTMIHPPSNVGGGGSILSTVRVTAIREGEVGKYDVLVYRGNMKVKMVEGVPLSAADLGSMTIAGVGIFPGDIGESEHGLEVGEYYLAVTVGQAWEEPLEPVSTGDPAADAAANHVHLGPLMLIAGGGGGGSIAGPTNLYDVLTTYDGVTWIPGTVRAKAGTP